ncbi:hypothetical protein ACU4IU_12605 [Brevibacterium sp. CSND-B09]|uniref:hypothetical protein n=1 Tax=Brevibacterium sp. CSND-B09 TaxID=3462571 RepID=UPI00406A402B
MAIKAGPKGPITADPLDLSGLSTSRAKRRIEFIERFCITPKGVGAGELVKLRGFQKEIITGAFGKGIVSAGKHLIAAKADVNHGKWLPMLKEIGIDQATARMLMQIGRNTAISNRCNSNDFPTAVRALYELSRLNPSDIEDGIESGDITPDMSIKDAKNYAHSGPSPEEQRQRNEEALERGRANGTIPPTVTEEELDAGAEKFVRNLVGGQTTSRASLLWLLAILAPRRGCSYVRKEHMHIYNRPFYEKSDWVRTHEEIADRTRVSPAVRANGEPGVLIKYGRSFAVLGMKDAITFATLIADTVEISKKTVGKK